MNIKLIAPCELTEVDTSSAATFKIMRPNLPLLAAYTPPGHRVKLVDESFAPDDPREDVDLVGITVMTDLALRAYEIADGYRQRGVPVVLGGVHATVLPAEALDHADSVVVGEGETVWPKLVNDAAHGRLRAMYCARDKAPMAGRPMPRYDLYPHRSLRGYTPLAVGVETSRGCPHDCEFCSVGHVMGRTYRLRPASEVARELEALPNDFLFFVDDNFGLNRGAAKGLFCQMQHLGKHWVAQGPVSLAEDLELLRLMRRAGCVGLLLGFESVQKEAQTTMRKLRGLKIGFSETMRRFHGEGIMVLGAFIFGFDRENQDIFERTLDFALRNRVDLVQFRHLTPFPGTRLYQRLLEEERLLVPDWWLKGIKSNTLLFRPRGMTPEWFEYGLARIKKEFYSVRGIANRFFGVRPWKRDVVSFVICVGANLGFRKRYYEEANAQFEHARGAVLQGIKTEPSTPPLDSA